MYSYFKQNFKKSKSTTINAQCFRLSTLIIELNSAIQAKFILEKVTKIEMHK